MSEETQKQRAADAIEDAETVKEIWNEYWETIDELNDPLLDFVQDHPVFSREVGFHYDNTGVVESYTLAKGTPQRGDPRPTSEWEAVAAWAYKEALLDLLSEIDARTDIPRRGDEI